MCGSHRWLIIKSQFIHRVLNKSGNQVNPESAGAPPEWVEMQETEIIASHEMLTVENFPSAQKSFVICECLTWEQNTQSCTSIYTDPI